MNTMRASGSATARVPARRKHGFGFWVGRLLLTLLVLITSLAAIGASYEARY